MNLVTIELVEGCFYWIKPAYEAADLWTVARWEHGVFWGLNGKEVTPRVISGPIPRPTEGGYEPAAAPPPHNGGCNRDEYRTPAPVSPAANLGRDQK